MSFYGTKDLCARAIEVIVFIFAAFGHFLLKIAPPEEADTVFAVGISSMLALCLLLFISAVSKNQSQKKFRKRWLTASGILFVLATLSALTYKLNIEKLTFPYPPENLKAEYIAGTVLTHEAQKYWNEHPLKTPAEIVAEFGGLAFRERVWKSNSIRSAKMLLTINYVVLVLTLASTIFCLTEGVLVEPKSK